MKSEEAKQLVIYFAKLQRTKFVTRLQIIIMLKFCFHQHIVWQSFGNSLDISHSQLKLSIKKAMVSNLQALLFLGSEELLIRGQTAGMSITISCCMKHSNRNALAQKIPVAMQSHSAVLNE